MGEPREDEETTVEATESAQEAQPKKRVPGRPFTSENAAKMAVSAAQARRIRTRTRAAMVSTVAKSMDLGEELVKAIKAKDSKYVEVIERALKLVGLDYAASEDARVQNLKIDAKSEVKASIPNLNITFKDAK